MNPTASELIAGCSAALTAQPIAEDTDAVVAARLRFVAIIITFVAQECAVGADVRMWENAAIRSLVANASEKYGVRFAEARNIHESDYSLACLDEVNARLRRHLIDLHELAEADADTQLDRAIIALYREIARRRELTLSPPQRVINLTLAPGGTDDDRIYGKRHSHGGS